MAKVKCQHYLVQTLFRLFSPSKLWNGLDKRLQDVLKRVRYAASLGGRPRPRFDSP